MIELPEALALAEQMTAALTGRQIVAARANTSPHKFAFYTGDPGTYAERLPGRLVGPARTNGNMILVPLDEDLHLVLGEGGERIFLHRPGAALPAKHQLWLALDDGSHLTVSIQGWGAVFLLDREELAAHPYAGRVALSPLDAAFTEEHLNALLAALPAQDKRSIKAFIVSDPGVWCVGNGCLQDILFRARLHPRTRAVSLDAEQRTALYGAIRHTLEKMVALGGRDSELDLYGNPGRYARILHSGVVGRPCPVCSTAIEKQSFLGGSVYFCPACQPAGGAVRS